ncbi:MAG: 4-hydroxyphenylpyruvate dioxygenase [Coleofasciculus sp. C1-SOL-03]|jgi:4-hydroxyphenylpyruvate dioxygenase|uniref:4-hydroxyphenylpyruvate dioxygenase n=1 Tax=Coleofasciculus sp. C1-SOL-03 TaxID=3069522 RepID=UPI0032FB6E1D
MRIDHIHFYVKDALTCRDWFVQQMGFEFVASGASCHTRTTIVNSGAIYFVLSSAIASNSPVAQFLRQHPPGVADIAFKVTDLEWVMERLLQRGAKVIQPLQTHNYEYGCLKWAKVAAWGDMTHTLVERCGILPIPDFPVQVDWLKSQVQRQTSNVNTSPTEAFTHIDHIVLNVAAGDLPKAVQWYQQVLDFQPQQVFTIHTENSGLCSQVMVHPVTGTQLPINEPTSANSQIQEFLDVNRGPGIQHIALATRNIVNAIAQRRRQGMSFINIPPTYYSQLGDRHPSYNFSAAEWEAITQQQILVDWQAQSPQALLLQTFTQPIFAEPTFFFEFIERRWGAQGFGEGNFRALFEAIEREQVKRGCLPMEKR